MKKNEIKAIIEKVNTFYFATSFTYGNDRDAELKKNFGDGFGYSYDDAELYIIDGVTYNRDEVSGSDIAEAFLKTIGLTSKDDYNAVLKELTYSATVALKEGDLTTDDALSLLLGFLNGDSDGGVVLEKVNGEVKITPDGYSCYPSSYSPDEFIKAYSK